MQTFFNPSEWSATMAADPHERVIALEQAIGEIGDYVERCRKAMQLSRMAIVGGIVLIAGAFLGFVGSYGEISAIAGFAAMIGGFVWLGANKSSGEEARVALLRAREELARTIDELGLHRLN